MKLVVETSGNAEFHVNFQKMLARGFPSKLSLTTLWSRGCELWAHDLLAGCSRQCNQNKSMRTWMQSVGFLGGVRSYNVELVRFLLWGSAAFSTSFEVGTASFLLLLGGACFLPICCVVCCCNETQNTALARPGRDAPSHLRRTTAMSMAEILENMESSEDSSRRHRPPEFTMMLEQL